TRGPPMSAKLLKPAAGVGWLRVKRVRMFGSTAARTEMLVLLATFTVGIVVEAIRVVARPFTVPSPMVSAPPGALKFIKGAKENGGGPKLTSVAVSSTAPMFVKRRLGSSGGSNGRVEKPIPPAVGLDIV